MSQRTTDIGSLGAVFQSRARMLISMCEESRMLASFENCLNACVDALNRGGKLMLCGNGGFASVAQHTASELVGKLHIKRNPIPVLALGTDTSVLTCIANDFGYERVFSRQLEAIGKKEDILIVLSTSGKSKNILQVLSQARRQNIQSFAITGENCGSLCREFGAFAIEISTKETEAIQDIAMIMLHELCNQIESRLLECFSRDAKSIWNTIIEAGQKHGASTLILDRDGVINHLLPNDYIIKESDLSLNEDFLSISSELNKVFKHILIVTNQACIGKGLADKNEIDRINSNICNSIKEAGGRIDGVYTCPDSDKTSLMRKPNIGIADIILKDFPDVDFSKSVMVGDSYSDELFAERLGAMYFNIYNI